MCVRECCRGNPTSCIAAGCLADAGPKQQSIQQSDRLAPGCLAPGCLAPGCLAPGCLADAGPKQQSIQKSNRLTRLRPRATAERGYRRQGRGSGMGRGRGM